MTKLLSREQVNQYHNSGFVSPVDVLTQDEIKQSINEIENFEEDVPESFSFGGAGSVEVIPNPDPSGENTTGNVLQFVKDVVQDLSQ